MVSGPDASNSSLPSQHPVVVSVPPVPTCVRGERCALTGSVGRLHADKPCLVYASQKGVVCRNLDDPSAGAKAVTPLLPHINQHLPVLVYRGHAATVTAVSVSPSGAYCATGDSAGHFKVWALDHAEHLCKYEMPCCLTGPIRDVDWDGESKRIVLAGERAGGDASGACAKALQWVSVCVLVVVVLCCGIVHVASYYGVGGVAGVRWLAVYMQYHRLINPTVMPHTK